METPRPLAPDWLVGGGEIGARIRAHDWSRTPLGPIQAWPQSLRSALSICLGSRFPIVLYWGADRVVLYNDAYAEILGKKHPWALGRACREVWSEIWDVIAPMLDGVVASGQATWSDDQLLLLERRGYPEECYFSFSFSPVGGAGRQVEGVFTAVIETTRRVLGERRLRTLRDLAARAALAKGEEDAWRAAAVTAADDPADLSFALLYRTEPEGSVARLAAAYGFGHPPPPAIDLPCENFEGALVLPVARPGGAPYGYLVAGIGSRRTLDDEYRGFLALVADQVATGIANARAYEEERTRAAALAELDRAKTAFFSNVSHEFRTPLTLMLGPLEDLQASALPEQSRALVEAAQRNGQRLLKLVNTLLDFARIEAGRAQASYEPTDLAALTADLASNFRSACERAGLRLTVNCPSLRQPAYVDREMWEKIVLNLVSNAFKFTLAGAIDVALKETDGHFQLAVSDTGSGIPAEELPHMFERFHRVQAARGRSHEGSGIGLALVNELVKLHGGSIAVASALDEGSRFTVTLPKGSAHLPVERVKAPREASSTAARAGAYVAEALGWLPDGVSASPSRPQNAQRIVVADDNADMREYVRRLLIDQYEVEAVGDGRAALAAARARRPKLIISDVMMPQLDGFGLIRELRADPELATIPVVLLSARAGEEARLEGLGKGADDYLVKPFSPRELLVRVGALVRSAELHRRANEARAQFETLLNEAPLGVYLVDQDFRIAAVNPVAAPAFGDIPGLIGRDFDEVIHILWPKAYADEIVHIFRRTLETGEPHIEPEHVEQRLDRGVTEYYEWRVSRIPLPGNRRGVVCYFRDISNAVTTREALRDADSRKDEFLATLAHELRNPLAPLRSSLDVLSIAATQGAPPGPALEIMERQLSHLVRLVDDLMELSRITRGNFELRKEPVRLDAALRSAIEACEPLIRAGGHRLELSLPPDPIVLDADPVRLAQVFGNLLNNAAKYSERGGTISVEARAEGLEAMVSVSDTGDGIAPESLPQLFKMFFRGSQSARRNQSGLGIGLPLVRRLVEMHAGRIDAHSEGLGRGSRFTVRLPLDPALQPAPAAAKLEQRALAPMTILVVDDNHDAAESMRLLLRQVGADVRVAHDGAQALAAFDACRPRMVLLDIGMPGMDGYEVARRMRASPYAPEASLVALTGWGQDEDRKRVREAGFDNHLVKPADLGTLQSLITTIQAERH
jgi:PAS domain S-box-containing protein